jgi:signal transduction histidine kinase
VRLKSLYVGMFAAIVSTLALSFLIFDQIADRMQKETIDPTFERADELELESARGVYESEGPEALRDYLQTLDRIFHGSHFLLDVRGVDVITHQNRSALLPPPPANKSRTGTDGDWHITHRSEDGLYWFVAISPLDRPHLLTFLPYYFLVIGAIGLLCWLAAVGIVSPIRRTAATISRFGQGDLAARVQTKREDEIGQLGRSFNQMAERLERLIVSERRLLSDISHELRSPLARLKFAVKLARTSTDTGSALDRIERDINRMASLVSDIVEITNVESDPALQGAEEVRIAEILDEVIDDCAMEAGMRGCHLQMEGRIAGQVLGNRELLRRALENVARNAIRYAPDTSTIYISVDENQHDAVIVVRDHGPGVPEEDLTHIFDPFFRVEEARNANGGGSGLGLSIAKRAVQLHHGNISAHNSFPGLRVEIRVPLAARNAEL